MTIHLKLDVHLLFKMSPRQMVQLLKKSEPSIFVNQSLSIITLLSEVEVENCWEAKYR